MNERRFVIGEPNNWGRNNEDCIAFGMTSHINTTFNDVPCEMNINYPVCSSPPPSRVKITSIKLCTFQNKYFQSFVLRGICTFTKMDDHYYERYYIFVDHQ